MNMDTTTASEDSHTKIYVRSYDIGAAKTIPKMCLEYGKIVNFYQSGRIFFITYSKRSDAVRAIDELNKFQNTKAEFSIVKDIKARAVLPLKCEQQNTHNNNNNNNNNNVRVHRISNGHNDYGLNQNFDSFTINAFKEIISKCNLCSKMTSNKCSTCYDHYCSLKCQTMDWPKHKSNCKPVPILLETKINDSISVHSTNTAHLQQNVFNESACEESDRNANITYFNKKSDMNYHNNNNNNNNIKRKEHRQFQCQKQNCNNNNFRRNNFNFYNKQDNKRNAIKDKENITNDIIPNSNSIIKEPSSEQQHTTNQNNNNLEEIINDNKIKPIIPLANSVVAITNACTSTMVYCRSLQEDHKDGYARIVAEIFRYSLTAKPLQQIPQRNETILAKYEDAYYRAIVLKPEKNLVQVFFIDFGNTEWVKLEDLKEIDSDNIKYLSQYICRADLCEIPQHLTPAQKDICVNYLQSMVDEPLQILYTGELSRVKFKIIKNGQYVHDNILELINKADKKTTTSSSPEKTATETTTNTNNIIDNQSTITEYFMKDIKYKELKAINFELIILDTSNVLKNGTFHAVLPHDIESLIEINSILTDFGEENEIPYRPKEFDELCVVKYMANGQWYRAIFHKYFKKDNKFEVIFLDYGNICLVDAENIRSINSSLLFPCVTVTCCVKDILRNAQPTDTSMRLNTKLKVDETILVEKAIIVRDEDTIIHELIIP